MIAPERFGHLKCAERFIIKCALRCFECGTSLNSALDVRNGVGTFGKLSLRILWLLARSRETTTKGPERDCLSEGTLYTIHSSFYHLQSAIRGAQIRRCSVLVFLAG